MQNSARGLGAVEGESTVKIRSIARRRCDTNFEHMHNAQQRMLIKLKHNKNFTLHISI